MKRCVSIGSIYISIAMLLLAMELFVRVVAPKLSENIEHIESIPDVVGALANDNSSGQSTILFLGNSLIDHAVNLVNQGDGDALGDLTGFSVFKVVPDGTSLWDWYCITKNKFADSARSPQIIVIGYAWGEVPPVPSRLAGYFCDVTDLSDLYELGMNRSSDVLEYLAASVSKLYVMRETIRKRILDLIIPDYRESVREVNAATRKGNADKQISTIPQQGSKLMDQFLELLNKRNIRLIFIAMPVIKDYLLDDDLVRTIRDSGGVVYDYRHLDGITDSMFLDPIHLNDRGSRVFTRRLAADITRNLGP